MPHLILEISRELLEEGRVRGVLLALHDAASATGIVQADDLKLRVTPADIALIGGQTQPFVHLTVALLAGRSDAEKLRLSETLLGVLCDCFDNVERCSVEIRDMHAPSYKKRPFVTPSQT